MTNLQRKRFKYWFRVRPERMGELLCVVVSRLEEHEKTVMDRYHQDGTIARAAYCIWVNISECQHGHDIENWLEAEMCMNATLLTNTKEEVNKIMQQITDKTSELSGLMMFCAAIRFQEPSEVLATVCSGRPLTNPVWGDNYHYHRYLERYKSAIDCLDKLCALSDDNPFISKPIKVGARRRK